jgi:hypothetical protein
VANAFGLLRRGAGLTLASVLDWRRTQDAYFPAAALADGQWWVLRLNSFPDHPLWTLFVDGVSRGHSEDTPPGWGNPSDRSLPRLPAGQVETVLAPLRGLVAFGSEDGNPCDGLFCCA